MQGNRSEQVRQMLSAEPQGLSEPELRRRLRPRVSQPTLWRILNRLRVEGRITTEGRARSTRYHASDRTDVSTLRSRRLHQHVAQRLVADPSLRQLARARLQTLRQVNPHGGVYHDRWSALLDGPLPQLLRAMTEDSEAADSLRKESPFSVMINSDARRRIFTSIRAA